MPTQRISIAVIITVISLFSCDQKKNDSHATKTPLILQAPDAIYKSSDLAFNVLDHAEAFAKNITQHFIVTQRSVSVIICKKGLKITITPATLEKIDGSAVDGKINVQVIELTNSEELFKANAATISNGRLLASGGSYYVGMDCNGQQLRIKNGQHLQMQFPQLKKEPMKLFYGQRNSEGEMNWQVTNAVLKEEVVEDGISFTDDVNYFNNGPRYIMPKVFSTKPYYSLDEKAYLYDKKMPIRDIIDSINKHTKKVYIDTIYPWPAVIGAIPIGARRDSNYMVQMYGPYRQYLVKVYRSPEEINNLAKEKESENVPEKEVALQPKRLADQLQKYYQSSEITYLGWINCDRFYQENNPVNMPVELPVTFNKGKVHYFIIFKSFNGLLSGQQLYDDQHKIVLNNLPAGQSITLVAFTKVNGEVFHCKEDFIVQNNRSVQLDLKVISPEELAKIFGKNIHI